MTFNRSNGLYNMAWTLGFHWLVASELSLRQLYLAFCWYYA